MKKSMSVKKDHLNTKTVQLIISAAVIRTKSNTYAPSKGRR